MTLTQGDEARIAPGFADPVLDAQACFRILLEAMAHPGRILEMPVDLTPPPPLWPASLATLLSLCDHETPLWLDPVAAEQGAGASLRFHSGVSQVEKLDEAAFALCCGPLPALSRFPVGTADYPERSATVIWQAPELGGGRRYVLRGPGIAGATSLAVAGLPDNFIEQWTGNRALFPQGIDLVLTQGRRIAALPRSLVIEREG